FDGNFRPRLWQRWGGDAAGVLRELFACADVVFADHRDIGVVLGGSFEQPTLAERVRAAAQQAFAAFPQLQRMACTQRTTHSVDHHGLGAMLLDRDGGCAVAPEEALTAVVDRIGGGDAFAAGVLHGLIEGWDAEATVRFGLAAGCLKHSIPGDFNPVSVAEVQALVGEARFDVRR
ncbi:sugar kinase, partial [Xanthomonas sp. Kuri4-1]